MPNRYIRSSAIESEAVNALSWQGEVFYRRLLNRVDDFGRFHANPALLRASLFPLQLHRVKESDIGKLLKECQSCGLLFTYDAEGKALLVINKWERGRAKASEYPPPPDELCKQMQTYVYTRRHKSAHAPDPDSDTDTDPDADSDTVIDPSFSRDAFDQFWTTYPRREGKQAARKAFDRIAADTQPRVIAAAKQYAAAVAEWRTEDRKFVPHPATWLNQGRYDDDPATWRRNAPTDNLPIEYEADGVTRKF